MPGALFNPFPGLRPFEPDEDHLFFGREKETDELLRRLRSNRFLSVVGTSGSGKSSLVRCGLIPSLESGLMAKAGSSWRVSMLRPGEDPIGHLAQALDDPDVIAAPDGTLAGTHRVMLEATLRRGTLGLVEAVRQARLPPHDNLLVLVDQFEELFRFRRSRQLNNSRDEAVAFVKLLLEATTQPEVPIYVVLTMRSDFIGDCMEYPGLPEAINASQYLVPRLTRDQLRSAITGPVAVGGGTIAPRLVLRLLNDLGDNQDQLPVLQHTLMRTWDHWERHRVSSEPIDIANYEAVGTLAHALSLHADEAYDETGTEAGRRIAEQIFKALADTYSDPRGVRRPTSIAELAATCEVAESDVIQIVEIFRRPGRSFLMPPSPTPLESHTIVDLSHESLIRCWTRLIAWAEEERASAAVYARLSREASWFEEGAAGLWGNPELDIGLRWRRDTHPTAAWARRYDESFDRAMQFLDRSEKERDRLRAERDAERKQKLRRVQWAAAVLFALLVVAVVTAYVAWRENARAATNLRLAKAAVDDMLASTDRNPARVGADAPQVVEFRRELLGKAKGFYLDFIKQEPRNEALLAEMAFAHFRLGHINRLLEGADEAAQEYQQSIAQFERLARDHPMTPAYRQAVASSYNWLGETLRPSSEQYAKAEMAYSSALRLQTELFGSDPTSVEYAEELARTHYNRGILYASIAQPNDSAFGQAEADFREAIRLLGTLAAPTAPTTTNRQSSQELGRAYSNLAGLLQLDDRRLPEAKDLFERAVGSHEALMLQEPSNREYKVELVMFYDNLADALRAQGQFDAATARNEQAHDLVVTLGRPVPSLGIMEADNMTMRGRILQARGLAESARQQYQRSLEMFKTLEQQQEARRVPEFHLRFGDLLINSAALCDQRQDVTDTCRPLSQAFDFYVTVGRKAVAAGSLAEAQQVVESLSRVIAPLPPGDRIRATSAYQDLQQTLREKVAARK